MTATRQSRALCCRNACDLTSSCDVYSISASNCAVIGGKTHLSLSVQSERACPPADAGLQENAIQRGTLKLCAADSVT